MFTLTVRALKGLWLSVLTRHSERLNTLSLPHLQTQSLRIITTEVLFLRPVLCRFLMLRNTKIPTAFTWQSQFLFRAYHCTKTYLCARTIEDNRFTLTPCLRPSSLTFPGTCAAPNVRVASKNSYSGCAFISLIFFSAARQLTGS